MSWKSNHLFLFSTEKDNILVVVQSSFLKGQGVDWGRRRPREWTGRMTTRRCPAPQRKVALIFLKEILSYYSSKFHYGALSVPRETTCQESTRAHRQLVRSTDAAGPADVQTSLPTLLTCHSETPSR